jgi:HEAT repeat protein
VTTPPALAEDLRAAGVPVDDLSELVNTKRSYRPAVPVLVDWLQRLDEVPAGERPAVRELLVRSLSVPAARGIAAPALIDEFRRVQDSSGLGIRWVIANALSVVADAAVFDELVELARDRANGRAREMLMPALARTRHPKALDELLGLLDDEEVAGHAVMAIGMLGEARARPAVEPFLAHPESWVRMEAEKSLAKLTK